MKRAFLAATFSLFFLAAFSQTTSVPDFRGIKWGTHLDSATIGNSTVNFLEDELGTEPNSYRIEGDDMSIGTAELQQITYIFNAKNRFIKVLMVGNEKYLPDMEFILSYKFGEPSNMRNFGYVSIKEWKVGDVTFTLSDYQEREQFTLTLESRWEYSEKYKKNMNVEDF